MQIIWPKDLKLNRLNFKIIEFWIYRLFRFILLIFSKRTQVWISIRLHWVFRHLAVAVSSNYYGEEFLNSRSAVVEGKFIDKYIKSNHFVVDIACGTARYVPFLLNSGVKNFLGIDKSDRHIRKNKLKYPYLNFLVGNALDMEKLPKSDVMIASHFIEHLDDPEFFLSAIKNYCKLLIIEVPDFYSNPINLIAYNLRGPWWTDTDHRQEYSETMLYKLIEKSGFKIKDQKFFGGTIGMVLEN